MSKETKVHEAVHKAGEASYKALCSLADCANRVFIDRAIPAQIFVNTPRISPISHTAQAFTVAAWLYERRDPDAMQLTTTLALPLLVLTYSTDGLVFCAAGALVGNSQKNGVTRVENDKIINNFVNDWLDSNLGKGIAQIIRSTSPKPASL